MSRRQIAATFVISMTMITAGCGFITGQEALSFSAPPGTASGQAVSETGYEEVNVTEQVNSRNVTALGQSTEVKKFGGSARLAGSQVDVYIHAATIKHEGDCIVTVAIFPQQLDAGGDADCWSCGVSLDDQVRKL